MKASLSKLRGRIIWESVYSFLLIGAGSDYTSFLNYAGIPVMDFGYVGAWVIN